jgi:hypothetical protein
MTLESAAAAHLRLVVWCKACGRRGELDPAEQARWYGPETPVPEWAPTAGLLTMRQPQRRHGGDRDETVRAVPPLRNYEPAKGARYPRRTVASGTRLSSTSIVP